MMATKKMDPSEIEKVISAIRDREVDSPVPAPDQIQIRNLRHGLQKQLGPDFRACGLGSGRDQPHSETTSPRPAEACRRAQVASQDLSRGASREDASGAGAPE